MRPTDSMKKAEALFSRFARDTQGGIMIIFALVFTLLIFVAGMAIDFGRQQLLHDRLQIAADLAAVSGGGVDPVGTAAQIQTQRKNVAEAFYKLNFNQDFMGVPAGDVQAGVQVTFPAANQIAVTNAANISMPTSFVRVFGAGSNNKLYTNGASTVQINGEPQAVDILLAIDTSGSMTSYPAPPYADRITAAKAAATTLTNMLLTPDNTALPAAQQTRVGLISWGGTAVLVQGLTSDKAVIDNAINTIPMMGSTNTTSGLIKAQQTNFSNPDAVKAVLLMTDGGNNIGPASPILPQPYQDPNAQDAAVTAILQNYDPANIINHTYPNYPNFVLNSQSMDVCSQMKNNQILIYSVGLGSGNWSPQDSLQLKSGIAVQNLLSGCATGGSPLPYGPFLSTGIGIYPPNVLGPYPGQLHLTPSATQANPATNFGTYYFLPSNGTDLVNAFIAIANNLKTVKIIN